MNSSNCRILYLNIIGLYNNIASRKYDILLYSETFVSSHRHVSEAFLHLFYYYASLGLVFVAAYIRSGYFGTIRKDNVCNCHEVQLVQVCSRLNNFYVFSLYCNPDLNDSLCDCLFFSMSDIQLEDKKAVFIFVGDLNAHHQKWLGSVSGTNGHGVAAYDF